MRERFLREVRHNESHPDARCGAQTYVTASESATPAPFSSLRSKLTGPV